jgi:hypothetical protein
MRLAPIAVFAIVYVIVDAVAHPRLVVSLLIAMAVAIPALIYFGGRYYRPSYINKDKRCTAKDSRSRARCRYFLIGASFGNGCGRLREDGRCRYALK